MGIAERALIAEIRKRTGSRSAAVRVGIGDDCAVLSVAADEEILVTTDMCLEGIHFLGEWQTAYSVGQWCVTRGLSDIAAMGGRPVAVFLSLACPEGTEPVWIRDFVDAVRSVAESYGANLCGGDTAASVSSIAADIVVLGAVPRGQAVLRRGAKIGDALFVTGKLGTSQAELAMLKAGECEERRFMPKPQIEAGQKLRSIATAMIDISDGLSTDLAQICEESGVSAILDADAIPVAKGAQLADALHGGDEYQLLFTARAEGKVLTRVAGVPVSRIGAIRRKSKHAVYLIEDGRSRVLEVAGWQHRF
jgi:thiamine-monophosphate kinase